MTDNPQDQDILIKPPLKKLVAVFLICFVFVVISILMLKYKEDDVLAKTVAVIGIIFFGTGSLLFLHKII